MTWRKLGADEVVVFEESEAGPCFLFSSAGPEGVLWTRSACGVPVATWGHGLEHALHVLRDNGFHAAVNDVITRVDLGLIDPRCLADFCAGCGLLGCLSHLLERSALACDYVISLADIADEEKNGYIAQARDMARSVLAKRAANDALREMGRQSAAD